MSYLLHAYKVIPQEVFESFVQFKANKLGSCETNKKSEILLKLLALFTITLRYNEDITFSTEFTIGMVRRVVRQ